MAEVNARRNGDIQLMKHISRSKTKRLQSIEERLLGPPVKLAHVTIIDTYNSAGALDTMQLVINMSTHETIKTPSKEPDWWGLFEAPPSEV